jgi:hypothetical protein
MAKNDPECGIKNGTPVMEIDGEPMKPKNTIKEVVKKVVKKVTKKKK